MKIAVAGIGYVGLSNAIVLSQQNEVVAVDTDERRAYLVNSGISPIKDFEIQEYLSHRQLNLRATTDYKDAYKNADIVVVCTPTNYETGRNGFDTSSVDSVIKHVSEISPKALIVIKSTVPVGYTEKVFKETGLPKIIFSPEFLREGSALTDNLHPSRIIVGVPEETKELRTEAEKFAGLMKNGALKKDVKVLIMNSTEAESVKLFANTYLALRVSFFNELDTYAQAMGLDSASVIEGVCMDPRIGNYYNNPSFGYGGYCLPKDTRQLLANFNNIPQNVISAIVDSNATRKKFTADCIMAKKPGTVGIYRLAMKKDSDNYRDSSVIGITKLLAEHNVNMIIFEPLVEDEFFEGIRVLKNISEFKRQSDIIVANRFDSELYDVKEKVYTRDLYFRD